MWKKEHAKLRAQLERLVAEAKRLGRAVDAAADRFEALINPNSDIDELDRASADLKQRHEEHRLVRNQIMETIDRMVLLRKLNWPEVPDGEGVTQQDSDRLEGNSSD